jgi:hypothetical protein
VLINMLLTAGPCFIRSISLEKLEECYHRWSYLILFILYVEFGWNE